MTQETIDVLQVVLPAVAAAVGSVVATKVSVARLEKDVSRLYDHVEELRTEIHNASMTGERESSDLKVKLAALRVRVEQIGAPWQRKTDPDPES